MGRAKQIATKSKAACACEIPSIAARKAVAVDPAIKSANLKRLRRIEGQIRGLARMIANDRYCPDIMVQISSVHEALRAVGGARSQSADGLRRHHQRGRSTRGRQQRHRRGRRIHVRRTYEADL